VTRAFQKNQERHFVEEVAKRLGKSWNPGPDREHPDFIVTEGERQFGLEICEIFTGHENRSGSKTKKNESDNQRIINGRRKEYEAIENIPLTVHLVGDLCAENLAKVVLALVSQNLQSKPIGYHTVIDIETGLRAGLRVHVTKALRPDWLSVSDRVGWVDKNPTPKITDIVAKKSRELPRYIKSAGSDVRLLIIANRIHNSGKLVLEKKTSLDKRGFHKVYFFSYPETVVTFD
jgi:hypothetical protein